MSEENKLYPEDQQKVDEFLVRGVNSIERKPFKPLRLLFVLALIVTGLSVLSLYLVRFAGI